ncbi:hypothetical protein F5144DRAFT_615765 [Chaetomium tenue]|uniref:Uncharacterized protein n=1 Tax=Chaetomium tenue TaxID=1854479 RepID=A0ACB7NUN8_9PEZI|nr:hypothetical protein F5144DRAFT_615765 [Chaetomium globosum]
MGVDWRQGWVSAVVCVWAVRVGLFTFIRSLCRGGDSRFDAVRNNPRKFFLRFMLQGVNGFTGEGWRTPNIVSFVTGLCRWGWFWLGLWSVFRGLMIECMADWQLSKWRWDRYRGKHNEVFCGTNLWDRSRHPNYYGECLIWLGITMSCSSVVISTAARRALGMGWFAVVVWCGITPYFVYKMLRNFSIVLIEEKYDRLYMWRKDYRLWRRSRSFRLWLDGSGIIWGYI